MFRKPDAVCSALFKERNVISSLFLPDYLIASWILHLRELPSVRDLESGRDNSWKSVWKPRPVGRPDLWLNARVAHARSSPCTINHLIHFALPMTFLIVCLSCMWYRVRIISITCLKLVLMFRAIVNALWSGVILVGLARHKSRIIPQDFPQNWNWPSGVKTSVRNSPCTIWLLACLLFLGYLGHYPRIFQHLRENCP